jgi:hypothetical protein
LLTSQIEFLGPIDGGADKRPKLFLALSHVVAGRRGNDDAAAASLGQNALVLEERIGLGDGHRVDLEAFGDLANGGEELSGREPPAGDLRPDLVHDLPVERQPKAGVDLKGKGSRFAHSCITIIIHHALSTGHLPKNRFRVATATVALSIGTAVPGVADLRQMGIRVPTASWFSHGKRRILGAGTA